MTGSGPSGDWWQDAKGKWHRGPRPGQQHPPSPPLAAQTPAPPPPPPPTGPPGGNFWSRRSRGGKILLVAGAALAIIVVLSIALPAEDEPEQAASPPPPAAASPPSPQPEPPPPPPPPPEPAPPPPPPPPNPPPPVVVRGTGARVATIRLAKDAPTVVTATHRGSSNFAVQLVGEAGSELLVNEIGSYRGQVAARDVTAGRYRLQIDADGPWTIRLTQPVPTPNAKRLPGTISGRGAKVVQVQTEDDLQPIIDVRHRGQSNFAVYLIGYGDTTGSELLFNEIGNYSGQTLIEDMPAGSYLLAVQADGPWTVKFSP